MNEATLRLVVRHVLRSCALVLACLILGVHPSAAQSTTSLLPDATVLPRRTLDVRIASAWTRYDELLGTGGPRNLAASFNRDSLGSADIPRLGVAENAIRSLTGVPTLRLTAGNLVAAADSRILTAPLIVQYGLSSRLTLGVVIPFVESRTTVAARLNPRPTVKPPVGRITANVGPNPALNNPALLAQNAALWSSLRAADSLLQQKLTSCQATPSAPDCQMVLQQQPAVQSLIQAATSFASGLQTLYGTDAQHPGEPFVPLAGGDVQKLINSQITRLITQFQSFLPNTSITGSVAAAAGPPAFGELQGLLTTLGRDTLQVIDRTSIGDVSIGATYQLANTFGDTTAAGSRSARYRLAVNGTARLGTGQPASRNRLFDTGTGYGQPGVEIGAAGDVQRGRYSVTGSASYTKQLGTIAVSRIPNAGNAIFPLGVANLDAGGTYTAGDVIALSIVPRFRISGFFALTGQYALVYRGADVYSLASTSATSTTASISGFGADASIAQQVGIGFTYSTIVGPDRTAGRLPVEISFSHLETLTASGGPAPKTFRDQIELRWYVFR